jgi:hypothetical protein
MDCKKYIGMDVHQASISIAVRDVTGKVVAESVIETKAGTTLAFIRGIPGSLWITFEEGTSAAWLHDLLKPVHGELQKIMRRLESGTSLDSGSATCRNRNPVM